MKTIEADTGYSPLLKVNLQPQYIVVQQHKEGVIAVVADDETMKELMYEALLKGSQRVVRWAMPIGAKR